MAELLEFNRSLYDAEAVQAAAQAYSGLGRFTVEEGEHILRVTIEEPDPEVEELADHFANHCLFETITRSRRGRM
jgi:hypothetical protein